jgi:PAS domain S-box-containing protein
MSDRAERWTSSTEAMPEEVSREVTPPLRRDVPAKVESAELGEGASPISTLTESNARLRALFNGTYEFIGLLSPEGTLLEANRAALAWIGRERDEVIGLPFWETPWWSSTPGASEWVQTAVEKAANGEFVRQEVTLQNSDGTSTFDFSIYPILDERGQVTLLVPEGRNISERLRAVQEVERRYKDGLKLTEINRRLVGALGFDQVTAIVCAAARELTGSDGATFVVREGQRVRYAAEDSIAPLWKGRNFPIEECISGWTMLHSEAAVISDIYADARIPHDAYRSTFVQSLIMTPVGPGTPVASIGVYWAHRYEASDYLVELLKSLASAADLALAGARAYDDARRAWAEAEQANRLKDEFLATLSHELRNPLNSIVGFSELLSRSADAKDLPFVARVAEKILGNAQVQSRLINDLLDLSRLRSGKLGVERHPRDLVPLVAGAVEAARAHALQKQLDIAVELPEASLVVDADHVRVQQIVWNLLDNAIKFTPPGGSIRVTLRGTDTSVVLAVEDSGQGIEPEFLPHVFEAFRQGDGRTTRMHGGLGIGLALVQQLVQLNDGRVEAHSEGPSRGARFTLHFPLYQPPAVTDTEQGAPGREQLRGARLLIVDDTEDSVEMLGLLLSSEGASVTTALSGEDALRAAESSDFDLIISDISMPGMDGHELVRRLRASARHAKTPAIALTGFGREEDIERSKQAGFNAQLTKPLDFQSLIDKARAML